VRDGWAWIAQGFLHLGAEPGIVSRDSILRSNRECAFVRALWDHGLLKQARPDLLPWNYIGGVLLMPGDAVIKLRPLRIRQ
jgi:hypothetical protein